MRDMRSAAGGQNFDYTQRGGIKKRPGHQKINSSADGELKALGIGLWDKPGSDRLVIRAAGTKIQKFDAALETFTSLSEDTVGAGTDFLDDASTVPVVSNMFNTPTTGVLWMAGGAMDRIYGAYSGTKVTENGVEALTGSVSAGTSAGAATFAATGTYRYAVTLYKASTGVIGNCGTDQDCLIAVSDVTDVVTLTLSSLGAVDTTKYTKLYIYRSAVGGSAGFTTGDLIATLDISGGMPANTTDTGTSLTSSTNVPRAASTVLDNAPLGAGTYKTLTTFKRRLVTANGSTLYFSDLNKPESWPTLNLITVPSGGDITGLAVISYNSAFSGTTDELLCVFKQRELWIVTGSSLSDWALKFVDNSGCPNQSLIVSANGYLAWVSYRGVHLWAGSGKPLYASQCIEDKFQADGDINKTLLAQSFGVFFQARNEIEWYLSSVSLGAQKYVLKMDLRLTLGAGQSTLGEKQVAGVFTPDVLTFSAYSGLSFLATAASAEELLYLGDDAGFMYSAYTGVADAGAGYSLEYLTSYLDMGKPGVAKKFHKVVVWVMETDEYELDLSYWADYRYEDADANTVSQTVALSTSDSLVWDEGLWDVNVWDGGSQRIRPIVFNLGAGAKNNSEGDALRLQLSQTGSTQEVIIYGFSVFYTELGVRK